jgi:hypothetical protein
MVKLKLRVPTLDGLPKELAGLYRQLESGGFILDHEADPDGYGIDNLAALRGKLDESQRDLERNKKRLQGFSKADGSLYTVEEIQAMVAKSGEQEHLIASLRDKTKTNEQREAEIAAAAKKPIEAQLAKTNASVERYRTRAHQAARDEVINKILEHRKPQPQWRGLLAAELQRHIEIREDEATGEISHVIIDPSTKRARMSALTGRDGPMVADEFARGDTEFWKGYGPCLQGDGKKGADINETGGGGQQKPGPAGANIVLPANATQAQFEAAMKQARSQGGEVVFDDGGAKTS